MVFHTFANLSLNKVYVRTNEACRYNDWKSSVNLLDVENLYIVLISGMLLRSSN